MRKFILLTMAATFLGGALAVASHTPAAAQLSHTWVASNGNDNNNCERPTPCATFFGAYTKTAAGGEITCVDSGAYGLFAIEHSLTVNCPVVFSNTPPNSPPNTINIILSPGDIVTLRGLDFDAGNRCSTDAMLIFFNGSGTLNLEKMKISNCGYGIFFRARGASAQLRIADSDIVNNIPNNAGFAAGLYIKPDAGMTANVSIERSRFNNNSFGIFADGTGGGIIRGIISDSYVEGNLNNGISVNTNGTNAGLMVDNTKIAGNNIGLAAGGTNGFMLVRRSTITGNNTGLSAGGGGSMVTYKDNAVNNNTVDGTFSFALPLQ